MEARVCIECGERITGRIDKKFCSDQCRSAFNNQLNSDILQQIRTINSILKKNRRILAKLNPTGKTSIKRNKLLDKGFNFDYHTNIYKTQKDSTYFFCYDQGYVINEKGYITIVKRKPYVG